MESKLYSYDDIPLRLYLEIARESNYEKLVISGEVDLYACAERWESIVQRNSKENASFQYQSYFSLYHAYSLLLAKEFICKTSFMILALRYDKDVADDLAKRGYKIDPNNYEESLAKAVKKSGSMVTAITMKKNELERYTVAVKGEEKDGYEDLVADLEFALGWSLGDGDITLAKYNRLKKRAKQKQDYMTNKLKKK